MRNLLCDFLVQTLWLERKRMKCNYVESLLVMLKEILDTHTHTHTHTHTRIIPRPTVCIDLRYVYWTMLSFILKETLFQCFQNKADACHEKKNCYEYNYFILCFDSRQSTFICLSHVVPLCCLKWFEAVRNKR
jgi:hypothetical protein